MAASHEAVWFSDRNREGCRQVVWRELSGFSPLPFLSISSFLVFSDFLGSQSTLSSGAGWSSISVDSRLGEARHWWMEALRRSQRPNVDHSKFGVKKEAVQWTGYSQSAERSQGTPR